MHAAICLVAAETIGRAVQRTIPRGRVPAWYPGAGSLMEGTVNSTVLTSTSHGCELDSDDVQRWFNNPASAHARCRMKQAVHS